MKRKRLVGSEIEHGRTSGLVLQRLGRRRFGGAPCQTVRGDYGSIHLRLEQLETRLALSGYALTTLASFIGANGENPLHTVVEDSSGNLFGTTWSGGNLDRGTLFEWVKSSGTISVLANFNGINPQSPSGVVEDSSGNLFGTTYFGGNLDGGTLFEWVKGSGTISVLANFNGPNFNGTDGQHPSGVVEDSSGNLFGTTRLGGTSDDGTVFEWVKSSGTISILANFNHTDGEAPVGGVVEDSSGNLFGTTNSGGTSDDGTVFEWVKSSGTISVLANFNGANGAEPYGGVVEDSSGNLFGTTSLGTSGNGTLFEWVKSSGTISVLANFNGANGAYPQAGVIEDSSGNLFGTTLGGTVFEWVKSSGTISVLANFGFGDALYGGVVEDSSGDLFGTTALGGTFGDGTVFELESFAVTPSVTVAAAGEPIAYSISVAPQSQAQSIEVQDVVPSGTTLVPGSVTNGGVVSTAANGKAQITWNLPTNSSSATVVSFTITVNSTSQFPAPASLVDTATAMKTVNGQVTHESSSASVALIQGTFAWSMPPRYGVDINGNPTTINDTVIQNDAAYVNPSSYTLNLDASSVVAPLDIEKWSWAVFNPAQPSVPIATADGEKTSVQLQQGRYNVTLTLILSDGSEVPIEQQVTVRDILIVDMGESYSSGEGNPDVSITAAGGEANGPSQNYASKMWAQGATPVITDENAEAHRSTLAGSSQAAFNIQQADPHISVTYVMVSISGATMNNVLPNLQTSVRHQGNEDASYLLPFELSELRTILGTRRPDIIYLGMGGNDIGGTMNGEAVTFGDLIEEFLGKSTTLSNQVAAWEETQILPEVQEGLTTLASNYQHLATSLHQEFSPNYVIQADYPNPTEGTNGQPIAFGKDIAPGSGLDITQQESEWLTENVFTPLNNAIENSATKDVNMTAQPDGWQFADVADIFSGHGYGADQPWFQTATTSKQVEGYQAPASGLIVHVSLGTAHPNSLGQQAYAAVLQPMMQDDIDALLALPDLGLGDAADDSGDALVAATPINATIAQVGSAAGDPLIVTTEPPSNISAGAGFGLTVTAENADGTVDTSFDGDVSVSSFNTKVQGTTTVTAVNGVARFSGLTIDTAEGGYLLVSADGFTPVGTNNFTVVPAAASQLAVPVPNGNVLVGGAFDVPVIAEDRFGNVDTSFEGGVALALNGGSTGASLSGTLSATASGGISEFDGLTINEPGAGYALQATSDSISTGTSVPFDVMDQLVVTTPPPGTVTAGESFGLTLTVEDGRGNIDTAFDGTVTLGLTNSSKNPVSLGGTLTATAVDGVVSFDDLAIDGAGTGYTLRASSSQALAVVTGPFDVDAAPASQLIVSDNAVSDSTEPQAEGQVGPNSVLAVNAAAPSQATSPDGMENVLTNAAFDLQVTAEDPFGNVDQNFNGAVTLALTGNRGTANLVGGLRLDAVHGVANFSNLAIDIPASGYSISAASPGLISGVGTSFDVTNDALVVTSQPPNSVTAGTRFGLVVEAMNAAGNVDTSFNGSVTLTNESGSLSGQTVAHAVNGVASFSSVAIDNALADNALIANSHNLAPTTTTSFAVTPGNATKLVVTAAPPGVTMSAATFEPSFAVEDSLGNVVTTFNGTATIQLENNSSGATLQGTLTAAVTSGVATFPGLSIGVPGVGYVLQARVEGLVAATGPFNVAPAPPTLAISGPAVTYNTGGPAIAVAPAAKLSSSDGDFADDVVAVVDTDGGHSDRLGIQAAGGVTISGTTLSYNGTAVGTFAGGAYTTPLVITFNSSATQAAELAVVRNVIFRNLTLDPGLLSNRDITFQLTDEAGNHDAVVTQTVKFATPPLLAISGPAATYNTGGPHIAVAPTATLSNGDGAFAGASLSVHDTNAGANDRLGIQASGLLTISNGSLSYNGTAIGSLTGGASTSPLVVTFNANATQAAIQAVVRNITFTNIVANPGNVSSRLINFQLTDGGGNKGAVVTQSVVFSTAAAKDSMFADLG